jgi:uncharacterized protein YutE (UPF0331/DUF86 family)
MKVKELSLTENEIKALQDVLDAYKMFCETGGEYIPYDYKNCIKLLNKIKNL